MVDKVKGSQAKLGDKALKSVSDIMPELEFYPDIPKVKLDDILNTELHLLDAVIIEDFEGQFGPHPFGIMLLENPKDGAQSTCGTSGVVIIKKLRKLLADKCLPVRATFTKPGTYFNMV